MLLVTHWPIYVINRTFQPKHSTSYLCILSSLSWNTPCMLGHQSHHVHGDLESSAEQDRGRWRSNLLHVREAGGRREGGISSSSLGRSPRVVCIRLDGVFPLRRYFPLWLLPIMATSRYGCFPLWLLPVMAASRYGCFPLWLLPVMATSRYGCFPLWLLPVMAASRYRCFPLWLIPTMATSRYGYFPLSRINKICFDIVSRSFQ